MPKAEATKKGASKPDLRSVKLPADPGVQDVAGNLALALSALRRSLEDAVRRGDRDEIPSIAGAITSASNALAKITGAHEITRAQIVRSLPFREAMQVLQGVLEEHPEIAAKVAKAFAEFSGQ